MGGSWAHAHRWGRGMEERGEVVTCSEAGEGIDDKEKGEEGRGG